MHNRLHRNVVRAGILNTTVSRPEPPISRWLSFAIGLGFLGLAVYMVLR